MTFRKGISAILLCVVMVVSWARASVPLDYYLPKDSTYNPKVPTPEAFLGWQVGDWHVRSELVAAYLQTVAAIVPERIKLEIVGYTYERKPLILLTITSPENHRQLEKIRTDHLDLLDPAKSAALKVETMPVVINIGYSIHGDEPSGVNAMLLFVYHLAAAQGPVIENQLRQAVITLEAQRNPDGGDRAAQWFNQHKSLSAPSTDPMDREHQQAWPGGRYNHYWFDPNRDWLPLVHPEARARGEVYHRWRPNLLTDHHEMASDTTFFFQPGEPTRINPNTAKRVVALTHQVAAFHARALDGRGLLYFSEQRYDDFYPGKGSTYPDLHGTVGILFEQASARGHAIETDNGLLTLPFAIRNQVLTSFSTLEAALALRIELLNWQRDFPRETAELAARGKVRAYVFGDDGDPARAWTFLDLLRRHRIEVRPLQQELTADGQVFKPGAAWVALTDQAQYRLLTEIFIQRTSFEDNVFYDVSAWTLPMAFNLPFAELEKAPAAGAVLATTPSFPSGALVGGHSDYAYVIDWRGYYAPRALLRLQQAGIVVKGLTGAPVGLVAADGTKATVTPGAVLIPMGAQAGKKTEIRRIIEQIVRDDAVTVYGCSTGLTPTGVDLGSASFVPLTLPRVALISGYGADAQDVGSAWHLLDQRFGLTPTLLDLAQLSRADLSRYDVIIFSDGSYENAVNDTTLASLKHWNRDGGTLVLAGRALQWAAKKELAALEFVSPDSGSSAGAKAEKTETKTGIEARQPYGSGPEVEALKLVSGAILAASIDNTHPMGYGYRTDRFAVCRANMILLKPAKSPYETPAVYTGTPLRSGYASEANRKLLANSAAVVALAVGKGAVVAMPDTLTFRGFWYGGDRVFLNAVFYGRAIKKISSGEGADEAHAH